MDDPVTERLSPLLEAWSGPPHDPSLLRDELLHELFEASADRFPEQPAVLCGEVRLSYRALEERSNRLAHALRSRGVGRGDLVALLLPRSEHAYAAILAVLKAGAAYVPIDPDYPADRIAFIAEDSGAKAILTTAEFDGRVPAGPAVIRLDRDAGELARMPAARIPRAETGTGREDLCYLIYTSGTTGRPKGVAIEHRSACHLVRAESRLYGIRADDRILQLASIAFDASVEEVWLAFFHGAALVAGTHDIIRSGTEFSDVASRLGVTVLSCVPTFLSMVEGDIPTVRLLILGGEACPKDLAGRWHLPGRVMFNTYGPTEATVIATAAVLQPNLPVTIGRPISNYRAYILDDKLRPVPPGAEGELYLGGEGLARGYWRRPELDSEKFMVTDRLTGAPLRLYRTADLARFTPEGEIEHLGRADDQVKVRGFRVELSEIEAALLRCPGVLAAAAAVAPQTQQIAAYVVLRSGHVLDRTEARGLLAARLPTFMVPAFLDEVAALPMNTAAKIDRRRLPPPSRPLRAESAVIPPRTDAERRVAAAWSAVLGQQGFSVTDHFFDDLGGHSLLAAHAVSRLRGEAGFSGLSVGDLYSHPTVEALARLAAAGMARPGAGAFQAAPRASYLLCAAGQAAGLLLVAALYAWQWLGPFFAYGYLVLEHTPFDEALPIALLVYGATFPLLLTLSIPLKWALLGRIRPGEHPLWGWYFWKFWFVRAVLRALPIEYLAGTPFLNVYFRLMGARVGRNVFLASHDLVTFDLLSVGDGASVGGDTSFDGAWVADGRLKLAPVSIGKDCCVGHRCALAGGAAMADGSGLADLSMLPEGATVPSGELWAGSPAARAGRLEPEAAQAPWGPGLALLQLVGIFLFPLATLAAVFPGLMAITHLGHMDEGFSFLVAAPLVALSFVLFLCLEIWLCKRLLVGTLREGRYPIRGWLYARKWFFDQLMSLSLEVVGTLYATLYLRPWLKALGARIGRGSEISTIRFIHPDLLEAGDECFLADDVSVGAPVFRSGWMDLGRVHVGSRAFVGNSAVLPPGAVLGSNVLLGTLSVPPTHTRGPVPDGTSWFGSPPIYLPRRQKAAGESERQTYRPPRRLIALRLFIEFFRILLPSTIFVVLASLIMNATDVLQDYIELRDWLLLLPFMYIAAGLLAAASVFLLKRALIGRYRSGEHPLWSGFVWRTELVTGVYENLGVLFFIDLLRGTPFIAWVLRALGMRVGHGCYIDTTWFTEFDLIDIGDEAALNEHANVQTHLFEDRILKTGPVRIGRRCTLGSMSTVLYGTEMEDGSSLGDLSLLMKGESLAAGTRWHGIPARRSDRLP